MHSSRLINSGQQINTLERKEKVFSVIVRRRMKKIYIDITHENTFTGGAQNFYCFIKVIEKTFRRVMLSIDNSANYVCFVGNVNFNPKGLESLTRSFFTITVKLRSVSMYMPTPAERGVGTNSKL